MSAILTRHVTTFETVAIGAGLDVAAHVARLKTARDDYLSEDTYLRHRVQGLDLTKPAARQKAAQIKELRVRNKVKVAGVPLVIDPVVLVADGGVSAVRTSLVRQFVRLSKEERVLWMNALLFIVTPDLRMLVNKLDTICDYFSLGQQRNLLLGGRSGMGKSTLMNWFAHLAPRVVEGERNRVPYPKVDAPDNKNAPKALYERLIAEFGATYLKGYTKTELREMLQGLVQQCDTELVFVDECENITGRAMKLQFVDVCNALCGIPIICASANPIRFVEDDSNDALKGRFNDHVELSAYTGDRLRSLLAHVNLLLPFAEDSNLAHDLAVEMIQGRTDGVLRDIMRLIRGASLRAIETDATHVSLPHLDSTWKSIETKRVMRYDIDASSGLA